MPRRIALRKPGLPCYLALPAVGAGVGAAAADGGRGAGQRQREDQAPQPSGLQPGTDEIVRTAHFGTAQVGQAAGRA